MYKKFEFIAAFSLFSYFNPFVSNACLFCPSFMLGYYLHNAFCFHGVLVLLIHDLFISIIVLHHVM